MSGWDLAAQRNSIPVHVVVQTAASVDGYTDNFSVVLQNGVKKTLLTRWPEAVLADTRVVATLSNGGVALLTRTSDELLVLWREVLGDDVTAEDDFFDAGGDSLIAVQLIGRIRAQLGVGLPAARR